LTMANGAKKKAEKGRSKQNQMERISKIKKLCDYVNDIERPRQDITKKTNLRERKNSGRIKRFRNRKIKWDFNEAK